MEKTTKKEEFDIISTINKVEGFDPNEYLDTYKDSDGNEFLFLVASARIAWFWLKYPNGRIAKKIISCANGEVLAEARIYADKADDKENFISNGYAQFSWDASSGVGKNYVVAATTLAVSNALLSAGFGTPINAIKAKTSKLSNILETKEELDISGSSVVSKMPKGESKNVTSLEDEQPPKVSNVKVTQEEKSEDIPEQALDIQPESEPEKEVANPLLTETDADNYVFKTKVFAGKKFSEFVGDRKPEDIKKMLNWCANPASATSCCEDDVKAAKLLLEHKFK